MGSVLAPPAAFAGGYVLLVQVGFLKATTMETVRFERSTRVSFRVVRGPVPYIIETYELRAIPGGTDLTYSGELGTDLWRAGQWWGRQVAGVWESTVAQSLEAIRAESARRAGRIQPATPTRDTT